MGDRVERLAPMLEELTCDAFLSGSPADVHYFTGSDDTAGVVIVRPGQRPRLLTRLSAYQHVLATVVDADVTTYRSDETIERALVRMVDDSLAVHVAYHGLDVELTEALERELPDLKCWPEPALSPRVRRRKEPGELALLRRAAEIADQAMIAAMQSIRPGMREIDVAAVFESTARHLGATGAIGATQVKSGARAAFADAPASEAAIEPDSVGFIDIAIHYRHYLGDLTRAFVVGDPPAEALRVLETVDRIQQMARGLVRVGASCRAIDAEVRRACEEASYPDNPTHHTGHAMGLGGDMPRLVPDSDAILEEGDAITIEPGIYVPGLAGIRIEDILIVRGDGYECLSQAPRITRIG